MDAAPVTPDASNDIFSLSDDVLADKLAFIEEIGNGNWGSVWRCKPKGDPSAVDADDFDKVLRPRVAVKLVHRETKSKTSVARVKSLWNEMKIVRAFKAEPHPSVVSFYSFVITPSFALVTMELLPALVPVEVEESTARGWFRYLLSGVEFLHRRGVVHNDIKPANILISDKNIPVLVDFGFAERYDLSSSSAFHSKVAYGTPEYLAPERAREIPHDTRKSDVWSLGVTFFEILIGRTPFEGSDQEQFSTKEDLEKYWSRTLRGQWIGDWKMSRGMEKLLRRMISPNADLRCTISQAMKDTYWTMLKETDSQHRRSTSYASSIVFEKDVAKLANNNTSTPTRPRIVTKGKENPSTPKGLFSPFSRKDDPLGHQAMARVKSQPKVASVKAPTVQATPTRKRIPQHLLSDLSPIKASPPTTPQSAALADASLLVNVSTSPATPKPGRQPFGMQTRENLPKRQDSWSSKPSHTRQRSENRTASPADSSKENHVNQRVRDWERLREISRMDDTETETDTADEDGTTSASEDEDEPELSPPPPPPTTPATPARAPESPAYIPALPAFSPITLKRQPSSQEFGQAGPSSYSSRGLPKRTSSSGLSSIRNGIKTSIDKTVQLCKTSIGQAHKKARSFSIDMDVAAGLLWAEKSDNNASTPALRTKPSVQAMATNSSSPALNSTIRDQEHVADDRITMWMRNVEKVVDDARQGFTPSPPPLEPDFDAPPLSPPASRMSASQRSNRSGRMPRRAIPANQIFDHNSEPLSPLSPNTSYAPVPVTPTTSSRPSFEQLPAAPEGTPRRRAEKSRSHADLLGMKIRPGSSPSHQKVSSPRRSPPLDRRMFIDTPKRSSDRLGNASAPVTPRKKSFNDSLTESPLHVEPYPERPPPLGAFLPDTPNQRKIEGVYDRFLMATTGVKRLGKGYQSDNIGAISNTVAGDRFLMTTAGVKRHGKGYQSDNALSVTSMAGGSGTEKKRSSAFASLRRPAMPPPVSSDDILRQSDEMSVDELGMMTYSGPSQTPAAREERSMTVSRMRKALKAIVVPRHGTGTTTRSSVRVV